MPSDLSSLSWRSCCVFAPFVTKHFSDLHRVDELKNFVANNLFRLVIEVAYWDPRNWLVTYLGAVHQKGKLSL